MMMKDVDNNSSSLKRCTGTAFLFKTEAMDRFSDDELIEYMVKVFNGRAEFDPPMLHFHRKAYAMGFSFFEKGRS